MFYYSRQFASFVDPVYWLFVPFVDPVYWLFVPFVDPVYWLFASFVDPVSFQKFPPAWCAKKFSVADDYLSPRNGADRPALYGKSFIGAVVNIAVQVFLRYGFPHIRIDDHDVCIGTGADHPLLGIEAEEPRGVCAA